MASHSSSPTPKKQKMSPDTAAKSDNEADVKVASLEYDSNNPLVSLPPDALTAVLCRSPSSDHDALRRSCKTIRSTLESGAYASERVATGYSEVSVRHISKEELWQEDFGQDKEHDPTSEEYNAEESARRKEEQMAESFSDFGRLDESYGYHDITFDVQVDGRCRGSIHLVLLPADPVSRLFHEATDAHSQELQEVGSTLCDDRGRPKVKSIKDADTDRTTDRGGFLHVVSVRVAQACRPCDDTDVPSRALRSAITHPTLQGAWTLATSIADANVYFTKADKKLRERLRPRWNRDGAALTVEEEAAEKEKSKRWEECMRLDSRTFLRVGYQQIPEVLGPGIQANWFFALPRFLNGAILSDAEASEVGLLKAPELPPEPEGANKKLLDVLMRACYSRRDELDTKHRGTILLAKKVNQTRTVIASTRREVEEQEERLNIQSSQIDELLQQHRERMASPDDATRELIKGLEEVKEIAEAAIGEIDEKRTKINEAEAELNEELSKGKKAMAEENDRIRERGENLVQKVKSLIEDDGASIRRAFVLHCASRFRLNDLFDALLDLVPANERKAAINEVDFCGCTPLFTAAQSVPDNIGQANEQYDFVEKVLKLGADKNYIDIKGLTALGMYRTTLQYMEEFTSRAMLNSIPGRGEDDNDWEPIHERMEELLMPARGETEADRNAKKSPEPDYNWDEGEEGNEEESEDEEDGED